MFLPLSSSLQNRPVGSNRSQEIRNCFQKLVLWIIDLRAIGKSNHEAGIIEMRFTAGEDFMHCLGSEGR